MNESTRTITYVLVAAASVAVAWFATPPIDITTDELRKANLNKPFYDDFDPNDATSIRVVSFDEARAVSKPFAVEFKNGLWTIPSHHGYPADAKDQLAKTAASTIGVKREQFVSSSPEDYEQFGVVDPLDPLESSKLKGRGKRITLTAGEKPLFDLIIGKQVRERPGFYYVRMPDEKTTYVAQLNLQLSTKFSDWVETDLLKLSQAEVTELDINNYSLTDGGLRRGEELKLERPKTSDPWKLEGLDEETQELDKQKITDMLSELDNLKLVGVRPKPKGLKADMTLDPEYVQNQLDFQMLRADLGSKGFAIGAADLKNPDSTKLKLYSRAGELEVATTGGIVYTLQFGEIFSGDEAEIEIGEAGKDESKDKDKAGKEEDKTDDKKTGQSSRYVFVTTRFDANTLGAEPVAPERPEGVPADEPKAQPKVETETPKTDAPPAARGAKAKADPKKAKKQLEPCGPDAFEPEPADDDDPPKDDKDKDKAAGADEKAGEKAPEKVKTPAELKKEYEILKQTYEADRKAYEGKVKAGQEKVDELNLRFGDWYYVISADSFGKLHLSSEDLIKKKSKPTDKPEDPEAKPDADQK